MLVYVMVFGNHFSGTNQHFFENKNRCVHTFQNFIIHWFAYFHKDAKSCACIVVRKMPSVIRGGVWHCSDSGMEYCA